MKPATMRAIDWYLGIPLCYILLFAKRIRAIFPRKRRSEIKNIMVVKCYGLGSIILTAPAITALRSQFPSARIHYVTFSPNREILEILSLGDETYCIDTRDFWRFAASSLSCAWRLRRIGVDLALDYELFAKFPIVLAALAGARKIAGFYLTFEGWRKALLTFNGYYNSYWHIKDIFLSLVYLSKTDDLYYRDLRKYILAYGLPSIAPAAANVQKIKQILLTKGAAERRLVIINPHASPELAPQLRWWSAENYGALASQILDTHPDTAIVVTGTKSQASASASIICAIRDDLRSRVINVSGQSTIADLVALFDRGALLISTDSGPMHLAALCDIPIVGLFTADTPVLYRPLGKRVRVIHSTLYCVPSYTAYTGKVPIVTENVAAQGISVNDVYQACAELLVTRDNEA